ncbi:hypothetical protein [Actinacidiphila oryziradicis]|uniref:Uncharacterized protein n=1 Tax=Actinacidiphila oryziradicis TaxID=2571141 RepID=A0A4U0RH95_9ACTN|nr:hypothetical protein [Actinacidiphila oryziradicis]TJZ94949.1 hypothetical protein FCI23_52755 [Actinacidiphila oryziradicis]
MPLLFIEVDNCHMDPQLIAAKFDTYMRFFRRKVKDTDGREQAMWRTRWPFLEDLYGAVVLSVDEKNETKASTGRADFSEDGRPGETRRRLDDNRNSIYPNQPGQSGGLSPSAALVTYVNAASLRLLVNLSMREAGSGKLRSAGPPDGAKIPAARVDHSRHFPPSPSRVLCGIRGSRW